MPNTELRLLSNDKDVLAAFCGESFFAATATSDSRIALAVLVHDDGRKTRDRNVVAPGSCWGCTRPTLERTAEGQIKVVEWPKSESHE